MIVIKNLWTEQRVELSSEEEAWQWVQQNLPEAMLRFPVTFHDLIRAVSSFQNWTMHQTKPKQDEVLVPGLTDIFRAARILRNEVQDPRHRAALVLYEDDLEAAALTAAGVEVNPENRAALAGLLAVPEKEQNPKHGRLTKGEGDPDANSPHHYAGAPPTLKDHPLFGSGSVGMISGESPRATSAPGGHDALVGDLKQMGLQHQETTGSYGGPERSIIVHGPTQQQMYDLGKKYGQESVVWGQGGQHRLLYTTGENTGKYHPSHPVVRHSTEAPEDFYTTLPGQGHVSLYFDSKRLLPLGATEINKSELMEHPPFRHQGRTWNVIGFMKHGILCSPDSSGEPPQGEVKAAIPEGQATALAVQRALTSGNESPVQLGGKHSKGSWLLADPETSKKILLKPGSGKTSPISGDNEEPASQSQREAASWFALDAMGLGAWSPRADLLTIDGREFAAIDWLGKDWQTIGDAFDEDPTSVHHQLMPYLQDGTLHKLAAAEFIIGSGDVNSGNIMWKSGEPIRLIDHGSALAGFGFCPSHDKNSFVPWFLRIWAGPDWKSMYGQERYERLPELLDTPNEHLGSWLAGIDAAALQGVLERYRIMTDPTLDRLNRLQNHAKRSGPYRAINAAWTVGTDDDGE